jgi:ABC-2 type transport system ATP-binding protein
MTSVTRSHDRGHYLSAGGPVSMLGMTTTTTQLDEPAVKATGLSFAYGDFLAVRDVDLHVQAGQVFALLGTNGAGKTTTLELLQGYRRPKAGSVRVLGYEPVRHGRSLRRRTGVMLQEAGLITELTVIETLRLWQSLSSRTDDPDALLDRLDLAHRRNVAVERLSGGERRRLDVALAVWGNPDLVVLDEPTTGLDPESRRSLWGLILQLRDGGSTVLLTTHYLEEAEALADTLAIMHAGRIAVSGTLEQVLRSRPAAISAELDAMDAAGLPDLPGRLTYRQLGTRITIRIESSDLQRDLTLLLAWADRHDVKLAGLRATPASLNDVFHAVRLENENGLIDRDVIDQEEM